jgi:hypothetical protein
MRHDFGRLRVGGPAGRDDAAPPAPLFRRGTGAAAAPALPTTAHVPEIATSAGSPLPRETRERAEAAFGADFGRVRVHTGPEVARAAARVSARAFAVENDIYFGAGFFRPHTPEGDALLGHELAHVVQQRRGMSSLDVQASGDRYEAEAEAAGRSFSRGEPVRVEGSGGGAGSGALQRSQDPGADAAAVGTGDSPHDLPFLGEANSMDELRELVAALSQAVDAPLGIVPEDFAMTGQAPAGGGDALVSSPLARPLLTSPVGRPLQRAVVAGCNVPGVLPNVIGIAAHVQIGAACRAGFPGCLAPFNIPGDGQADLMRQLPPFLTEIGEIKPASWLGRGRVPQAAAQLAGYIAAYAAAFPGQAAMPMWSFTFPGAPFVLNPSQRLTVFGPMAGLYFYRCSGGTRRRVRVPVRVPVPVPVPAPAPAPSTAPQPGVDPGKVAAGAVAVGAGIGIGYLVYRGVRLVPSLFPPLWPTIPLNLAVP